jgi:hypothetical protein
MSVVEKALGKSFVAAEMLDARQNAGNKGMFSTALPRLEKFNQWVFGEWYFLAGTKTFAPSYHCRVPRPARPGRQRLTLSMMPHFAHACIHECTMPM